MAERLYIPCWCQCPHCHKRHEGCVPEDTVALAHRRSESAVKGTAHYACGHKAEYRLTAHHMPLVECDACCMKRVGEANFELVRVAESAKLEQSRRAAYGQ
jgi:hypothetical protein